MWKSVLFIIAFGVFVFAEELTESIDTVDEITEKAYRCLKSTNLEHVTVRVYANGTSDEVGYKNLERVLGRMSVNVYVVPSPFDDPVRQVEDMVNHTKSHKWVNGTLYIQITDPSKWSRNKEENGHFIKRFAEAAQSNAIKVAYLTSWYDYQTITGNTKIIPVGKLWYWETNGVGPEAQTENNFADFRPFGPFQSPPIAKQYCIQEKYCGLNVNRNVYTPKLF
ncbi:unnamed protein product [Bursaphelenchus xylophilus]|nr:unnamed protein product [Bursaphelenchus xylophilus]CAG9105911.1 unnamed protein product [Bursaphelenchus xylophilus]